jgi:formylmethanofuran dehydrogenase subunit B
MYSKAIIKIDNRGFLSEYMVIDSHEGMLRYIYGGRDKNITQVLYDANMMGDILFVIENTALIIWLPSSMILKQRDKVLEKLEEIKNRDDVSVYVGIANPNHNCNYVMINDGMDISLDKAIDSVKRIKIRNDKNKTLVKG